MDALLVHFGHDQGTRRLGGWQATGRHGPRGLERLRCDSDVPQMIKPCVGVGRMLEVELEGRRLPEVTEPCAELDGRRVGVLAGVTAGMTPGGRRLDSGVEARL